MIEHARIPKPLCYNQESAKNTNIKVAATRDLLLYRHNCSMTFWERRTTIKVPGYHTNLSEIETERQHYYQAGRTSSTSTV